MIHSILEGMAICAYAIGAHKGFIYFRSTYPSLEKTLNLAVNQAKGKGILDNLDIEVLMGAEAAANKNETVFKKSPTRHRGEPKYRSFHPPFPDLQEQPAIINNIETYANIPHIIEKGASWFAGIGAANFPGTKVITLSGDVKNRTFMEVPTNVTIREIIEKFGQGMREDRKVKAIQVGGASGSFIPKALLDTPIDFDSLAAAGAALGSGAFLVLDEGRDMVDVAARIAELFISEPDGKCPFCQKGGEGIREILEKFHSYKGTSKDLAELKRLGETMVSNCLCGLSPRLVNPLISTINNFAIDYYTKIQ
jgi:NADH:ubiquinone oxidoreductase subunit F (NADH-binding)